MSIYIHTDYYIDILEKRYCNDCNKAFIVGEELGKTVPVINCPYCASANNEAVAWSNEDEVHEMGCMGIAFHKKGNEYYDRCVLCKKRLTPKTTAFQSCCKSCQSRNHVTPHEGYDNG